MGRREFHLDGSLRFSRVWRLPAGPIAATRRLDLETGARDGYATALMDAVFAHPKLQGLRRFTLATGDAHGLYARYGFTTPEFPATLMERYVPDLYSKDRVEVVPSNAKEEKP